jgi:hypothetical protein
MVTSKRQEIGDLSVCGVLRTRCPHIPSTKGYNKTICQVWRQQSRYLLRLEFLKRSCRTRKELITQVGEVSSVRAIKTCTLKSWPLSKYEMECPLKFMTGRNMTILPTKKRSPNQHAPRVPPMRWKISYMDLSKCASLSLL